MNDMKAYTHGGDIYGLGPDILDFSSNINPLGMPEAAKRAVYENIGAYEIYPDPLCRELRAALSAFHGLPPEYFVCGNGSADLIYRVALGLGPKSALIIAPAFSEYERALGLAGCRVKKHFLKPESGFNLTDEVLSEIQNGPDIVFIANPGNPTGVVTQTPLMLEIAEKCRETGAILIADECFADFPEQDASLLAHAPRFKNVIILKAFTKFYAMAGLRLGYSVCADAALNERVRAALQPWSVSAAASKCGIAALSDSEYIVRTKSLTARNREKLSGRLAGLGLTIFDSKANYVFFKSGDVDLYEKLLRLGVLIRDCRDYAGLSPGFYRAAVRGEADNDYLIKCVGMCL